MFVWGPCSAWHTTQLFSKTQVGSLPARLWSLLAAVILEKSFWSIPCCCLFLIFFFFIYIFCLSICLLLLHGFGRSYASWHPHGHHGIVYVQSKVQPSRTSLTGPMCKVMGCKGTSHSLDVFKTETWSFRLVLWPLLLNYVTVTHAFWIPQALQLCFEDWWFSIRIPVPMVSLCYWVLLSHLPFQSTMFCMWCICIYS